ncbi:MAG: succinate dehydrogenase [Cytophagales bacterium]|nr:MAG: succinate dehydrogenase [Cytophagales bacterium]
MNWFLKTFSGSIGRKLLMALTGLFLCTFLIVHLIGNFQLLKQDGGEAFNFYAKFMTSNPIIKTTSYLLYSSIVLHIIVAILITLQNKKSRPQGYVVSKNKSSWASRNMGILGTFILVFIVVHMKDFWAEYHFEDLPMYQLKDGSMVKDLYLEVFGAFKNIYYVGLYVFCMGAVGYHLWHGFESGFQTLGLNHKKYTPWIQSSGKAFSVLIAAAFAFIPLYIYFIA